MVITFSRNWAIVVVDPTGVAKDGAFVVAGTETGYVLRRLRLRPDGAYLEALAHGYPAVALDEGLESVLGVVVQRAGRRRRDHRRYD